MLIRKRGYKFARQILNFSCIMRVSFSRGVALLCALTSSTTTTTAWAFAPASPRLVVVTKGGRRDVSSVLPLPFFSSSRLSMASTLEEKETTSSEGEPSTDEKDLVAELVNTQRQVDDILPEALLKEVQLEAELAVKEMVDDSCEFDDSGQPIDEICADEEAKAGFRDRMRSVISSTLSLVRGTSEEEESIAAAEVERLEQKEEEEGLSEGERLELGWEKRANSSSIRRNAEVWKFALKAVFRALKPRKMRKSEKYSEEEIKQAQIDAATFLRDGLLTLGPSFVKLGQVASTRTDVLPTTYTDILKTLTDEVPGFSGKRAKEIASRELGRPVNEVFTDFSDKPLKAASLGQVHTAYYKGKKVAIKV